MEGEPLARAVYKGDVSEVLAEASRGESPVTPPRLPLDERIELMITGGAGGTRKVVARPRCLHQGSEAWDQNA